MKGILTAIRCPMILAIVMGGCWPLLGKTFTAFIQPFTCTYINNGRPARISIVQATSEHAAKLACHEKESWPVTAITVSSATEEEWQRWQHAAQATHPSDGNQPYFCTWVDSNNQYHATMNAYLRARNPLSALNLCARHVANDHGQSPSISQITEQEYAFAMQRGQ